LDFLNGFAGGAAAGAGGGIVSSGVSFRRSKSRKVPLAKIEIDFHSILMLNNACDGQVPSLKLKRKSTIVMSCYSEAISVNITSPGFVTKYGGVETYYLTPERNEVFKNQQLKLSW
jgi:hypothetical protein